MDYSVGGLQLSTLTGDLSSLSMAFRKVSGCHRKRSFVLAYRDSFHQAIPILAPSSVFGR